VGEVNPGREFRRHGHEVVVGTHAQRACAEGALATLGAASSKNLTSFAVETARGRPSSGRGGSSGWIAIRTPNSSAAGTTARRN
jgi:hypothetical protein